MFILVKEAPFGSASEVIEDEDAEEGLKSGKYVSGGSRVVREVSAHSHSKIVNEDKSEHETHYKRKDERAEDKHEHEKPSHKKPEPDDDDLELKDTDSKPKTHTETPVGKYQDKVVTPVRSK